MLKRVIGSCFFLAGGVICYFGIMLLGFLAASQAGMSAAPIHSRRNSGSTVIWLLSSYFALSAVAAVATEKKRVLWVIGSIAHSLVIAAIALICWEEYDGEIEKFVGNLFSFCIIALIAFLPWLLVWVWLLNRAKSS